MSPIRRIVLTAVIGGTILAGWTGAAAARQIGVNTISSPTMPAATADPRATASGESDDLTLPIALAAGVVLLLTAGTAGFAYRARTSRRAVA